MESNRFTQKNKNEDLLRSIAESTKTLSNKTQGKSEETLELKLNKSKILFPFIMPLDLEGIWLIGLTS